MMSIFSKLNVIYWKDFHLSQFVINTIWYSRKCDLSSDPINKLLSVMKDTVGGKRMFSMRNTALKS